MLLFLISALRLVYRNPTFRSTTMHPTSSSNISATGRDWAKQRTYSERLRWYLSEHGRCFAQSLLVVEILKFEVRCRGGRMTGVLRYSRWGQISTFGDIIFWTRALLYRNSPFIRPPILLSLNHNILRTRRDCAKWIQYFWKIMMISFRIWYWFRTITSSLRDIAV